MAGLAALASGHDRRKTLLLAEPRRRRRQRGADASADGEEILLNNLYVVNGRDFADKFPLFKGKVQNKKRQIPLPKGFFG